MMMDLSDMKTRVVWIIVPVVVAVLNKRLWFSRTQMDHPATVRFTLSAVCVVFNLLLHHLLINSPALVGTERNNEEIWVSTLATSTRHTWLHHLKPEKSRDPDRNYGRFCVCPPPHRRPSPLPVFQVQQVLVLRQVSTDRCNIYETWCGHQTARGKPVETYVEVAQLVLKATE